MKFETAAVHAGMKIDGESGAIATPIHLSTTFQRDEQGLQSQGYGYIREGSPTQTQLEDALAAIDGAACALTFASGMAAGAALLQALPRGARVLLPDDSYYAYRLLAGDFFDRWGLSWSTVPMDDRDAVERALTGQPVSLLWLETPSNPLMKVVDIELLAGLAHQHGALCLVDGTFATPALQQPTPLGADIVLHSTTKYLGGHTDVQGGSLAFARRDELYDSVLHVRTLIGAVAAPFNSWLVLRGIRSLAARMRVHSENALAVATFLTSHPAVETVYYPGLASHPGHEIVLRQMRTGGGMLSFLVRGGREEALGVAARTQYFTRATSLGGVESLIEHRATSEGPTSRTPANLLRVSVGLEHPDDLIEDLRQALGGMA